MAARCLWMVLAVAAAACSKGGQPAQAGAARPVEQVDEGPEATTADREGLEQLLELDLDKAKAIVVELEASWPRDPADPLAAPKSLDDVTAILKRDQVTLFAGAIAWLAGQDTKDALALHGQIELAWGETYILLVEVIGNLRQELASRASSLRVQGDEAARAKLQWIESSSNELALRSAALKLVAIEHIAEGSEKAEALIERHPDSYLGYRLMADYYRTLRDWEKFDEMVAKIQEINPKSNGLIFLRGAALFQRTRDLAGATAQYQQALKNDPQFVRAQAHLLLIQSDMAGTYRELLALEKLNPQHQLVVVAGEAIKRAMEPAQAALKPAS